MKKRDFNIRLGLVIVLLLVVAFLVVGNFAYYPKCEDRACFDKSFSKCARARYISEGDMIFEYKVVRKSGDNCVVDVKFLQGDLSQKDIEKVDGASMRCISPIGSVVLPEADIQNCHGPLREGLQDLIIEKIQVYLVQNLDRINERVNETNA